MLSAVNKQQKLTQYAGVGEPPGFTVGGVGRMAVGLTRVVCACCKKDKKKKKPPDKTHWYNKEDILY